MEFWLILGIAVAIFIVFPYLRCLFKRLTCRRKINRLCEQKGFALHPTHSLWFFGGKCGKECDLCVETPTEVYAIKLFGVKRRLSTLILMENGEYCVKHIYGVRFACFEWYTKPRALPSCDLGSHSQNAWTSKKLRSVLLINPITMNVYTKKSNGLQKEICYGDEINGMEIHSLGHLLKVLDEM